MILLHVVNDCQCHTAGHAEPDLVFLSPSGLFLKLGRSAALVFLQKLDSVAFHLVPRLHLHSQNTVLTVVGFDMLAILKMNKGPELGIGYHDDVPTPAAVSSARTTLRHVLGPVKVH